MRNNSLANLTEYEPVLESRASDVQDVTPIAEFRPRCECVELVPGRGDGDSRTWRCRRLRTTSTSAPDCKIRCAVIGTSVRRRRRAVNTDCDDLRVWGERDLRHVRKPRSRVTHLGLASDHDIKIRLYLWGHGDVDDVAYRRADNAKDTALNVNLEAPACFRRQTTLH